MKKLIVDLPERDYERLLHEAEQQGQSLEVHALELLTILPERSVSNTTDLPRIEGLKPRAPLPSREALYDELFSSPL